MDAGGRAVCLGVNNGGGGIGGDVQDGGNLLEGKVLPEFEVNHSPLLGGQFRQGLGEPGAKGGFVGIGHRGKEREPSRAVVIMVFVADAAPAQ